MFTSSEPNDFNRNIYNLGKVEQTFEISRETISLPNKIDSFINNNLLKYYKRFIAKANKRNIRKWRNKNGKFVPMV